MHTINSHKKKYKTSLVFTAAITLSLILCFVFFFDSESGYFSQRLPKIIFYSLYIVGAAVSLSALFIPSEFEILETLDEPSAKAKPSFVICALAIVLVGSLAFFMLDKSIDPKMTINIGIGSILFGAYIICILIKGYKFNILTLAFLFCSMILPLMLQSEGNANYYRHINSEENILTSLFSIAFLTYILFTSKRICQGKHSGLHFVSMLWTFMSGASLSIAYITAYILGAVNEGYRFYQMLIILSISAFMMSEMNRFINELKPKSTYESIPSSSEKG